MKPEQLAACNTEHGHQSALFCWANQNLTKYPELKWLFAIPNGGQRDRATASRLKAEGVKSGVSDVCLPVSSWPDHGLFLEMKRPGVPGSPAGKESTEQKEFGEFLESQGYQYQMCDHWEKARDAIISYLDKRTKD